MSAKPSAGPLFLGTIGQTDLPRESLYPKVSAYRGRIAWSHYDSATDQWVLMTRIRGRVRQAPVAPRAGRPFDVDLGPNAAGNTAAVYSRCRGSGGCDIYEFDFRTGKETAVSAVNTSRSEYLPSIWKTRIAFIRGCRGTSRCKRVSASVHLLDTDKAGSSKRISPPPRRYKPKQYASPRAVELRRKHVAYAWDYSQEPDEVWPGISQLRLYDGRRSRVLRTTSTSGAGGQVIRSPSFSDKHLLYFAQVGEAMASDIVRYSLATKRLWSTDGSYPENTFQVAWLDGRFVGTTEEYVCPPACVNERFIYKIRRLSTPKFERRRGWLGPR